MLRVKKHTFIYTFKKKGSRSSNANRGLQEEFAAFKEGLEAAEAGKI